MKNTYLLIGWLFISIMAVANAAVIAPVLQSFNQKFPEGTVISTWDKSPGGNFLAHFEKDGYEQPAEFRPDGSWVITKMAYAGEEGPGAVQNSIKAKYPGAGIDAAEKIFLEIFQPFISGALKRTKMVG